MKYDFLKIKVYPGKDGVEYKNPTPYKFLGRGYTGAVFKLSSEKCVKIYVKLERVKTEKKALLKGVNSPIIPKLYEVGKNYIVMEYVKGSNLYDYLCKKGYLSNEISEQILFCLKELKKLKFPRINVHLRHFIVTNDKRLKVIDHAGVYKSYEQRPTLLFNDLKKLGLYKEFKNYVKTHDPNSYLEFFKAS
ncbi:AarF/UbiB family protein [Halalkalibacter kiskunsagensis]|uniref:AarF/UbiB family protein n=1 Tax=Halalkalibacter kiskunsagensis TaxID=1548599 RepID=A0ABV6KBL6_9BACI